MFPETLHSAFIVPYRPTVTRTWPRSAYESPYRDDKMKVSVSSELIDYLDDFGLDMMIRDYISRAQEEGLIKIEFMMQSFGDWSRALFDRLCDRVQYVLNSTPRHRMPTRDDFMYGQAF